MQVLFQVGAAGALTDAELLRRFRDSQGERAEQAFAIVMERHAGMVFRVCRSILHDENDAFDAVQATFLVLFRSAGSPRIEGSAAPWLHGVALRTARGLRRSRAIRLKHETRWRTLGGRAEVKPTDIDDLAEVVHQELDRLPEQFRGAVLVCDLEGLTQEQAAQRLGWPLGTLQSRLSRGRDKLRTRLRHRGLAPEREIAGPAGLLPTVPPQVLQAITNGGTSAAVFALSESIQRSLIMNSWKTLIAVSVLTASVSAGMTWIVARGVEGKQVEPEPKAAAKEVPKPLTAEEKVIWEGPPVEGVYRVPAIDDKILKPIEVGAMLRIDVLEALPGRRLEGVKKVRPDGTISLGFYGDVFVKGLTRNQVKVKVVEQLRRFLSDEALGLVEENDTTDGKPRFSRIEPLETCRVCVEEDPMIEDPVKTESKSIESKFNNLNALIFGLERKLDEVAKAVKTRESK